MARKGIICLAFKLLCTALLTQSITPTLECGAAYPGTRHVNDRFLLGGPLSIRGFPLHSLGPRVRDAAGKLYSVGGDAFYAFGLSLLFPFPGLIDAPLRGHIWGNLGRCFTGWSGVDVTPVVSVGGGIVVDFNSVKVEVGYCLPLVAEEKAKGGLCFGVGMEFL